MNTYTQWISKANYTAFLVLLASLPYPMPFVHVCWFVWAMSWLLELRFLHRENIRRERSVLYLSIGVGVWMVWNILSMCWAQNEQAAWASMERYISLLAIPVVGIWGVNEHYDWYQCFKVLIISGLISVGVYVFTYYWVINHPYAWDCYTYPKIPIDWLNVDNLVLNIKHRTHYTNLLCLLIPCLILARKRIGTLNAVLASLVFLIAIYLTGSRIAFINLLIVGVITIAYKLLHGQKRWVKGIGVGIAVILFAVTAVLGMYLHPRNAGKSWQQMTQVDTTNNDPAFEPRFAIWQTALEHPEDYMGHGLGAGNASDYLEEHYLRYGWTTYAKRHYNPHNQYLSVCMELGIVAAVLFVLFLLGVPLFYHGKERYWMLCATGICMMSMMTDVLLGGLEGIVFINIAYLLSLVICRTSPADTALCSQTLTPASEALRQSEQ